MRILVTGGAGFIGSHLVDQLVAGKNEVLILDNFRTGSETNLHHALKSGLVRIQRGDVLAGDTLLTACREFAPQAIVHLAALVSVQEARQSPDENFRLNLETTQRVITAAKTTGVARVVFASSAAIYGENPAVPLRETERLTPISLYGAAKGASELLLAASARDFGFDAICLRFFNVFGLRQRPDSPYSGVISIFVDRAARQLPLTIFGDGKQTRDFIPVQDVAAAIVSAIQAPRGVSGEWNVCTGSPTTLLDVISHLEAISGHTIPVTLAPPRAGDIVHSCGNPTACTAAIGFRAQTPLRDALAELLGAAQSPKP